MPREKFLLLSLFFFNAFSGDEGGWLGGLGIFGIIVEVRVAGERWKLAIARYVCKFNDGGWVGCGFGRF